MWNSKNLNSILQKALGVGFVICTFSLYSQMEVPGSKADSLFESGNFSAAINAYAANNDLYSQERIARAYRALGNYGKATDQYEYLVGRFPANLEFKHALASLLYKTRAYERSVAVYDSLLLSDTLNPGPWYQHGLALKKMRRDSMAGKSFFRAYQLDSSHVKSIIELGEYYLKRRQLDSAHFFAERGLAIAPEHAELLNIKALAWYNDHQYRQSIPYFERLIASNYNEFYIVASLGHAYTENWQKEEAFELYKKFLPVYNDQPEIWYAIGNLYRHERREQDSADVCFRKAIELKQTDLSREYVALAGLKREQNRLSEAYEYYQQAFEDDSDNMLIMYNICELTDQLYRDQDIKKSCYEKFLELFSQKNYGRRYVRRVKERVAALE
ncbi:tetratricopeptide repeat protein [Robertkochia aurantiaca]|uniref:tetratricopeptide repeat protein n=1 Tax=Robertkochia aurantiaca TaxID=2873700 RepID=UPI001CCAFBB3|nr:tetratricopeptide repeat protein [Robertkochia sp. 3YJGBD-33]